MTVEHRKITAEDQDRVLRRALERVRKHLRITPGQADHITKRTRRAKRYVDLAANLISTAHVLVCLDCGAVIARDCTAIHDRAHRDGGADDA